LSFLFKWGFGRKWGSISSLSCFCCVSLFFANLGVLGTLILYGKISRGYVQNNEQKLNNSITNSCQYLQVKDLSRLLAMEC